MADGWIKMHRDLLEKPIWELSTPEQKTILVTLLLMVWHKPKRWEWHGKQFECKPGQCVTSLDSIVDKCGKGVSVRNVRTALERFENYGFLTNESTKQGRLITIVNWRAYQDEGGKGDKGTDSQVTNDRQTTDNQPTTNKNVKNVRMKEDSNSIKDTICQTEVRQVIKKWNETAVSEVKSISSSSNRYKMLRARLKEHGLAQVLEAIGNIESSPFLKGNNKTGWSISFDWFVKPNNFVKVLEGNYMNHACNQGLEGWGNDETGV